MTDLETRLDKLERENESLQKTLRRNVRVAQLLATVFVVMVASGAANLVARKNADFDLVTARQIRIVDEDGKAKVLLAGDKQASPQIVQGYIALLDDNGNGTALLGHWGNGDILWFENGAGDNLYLGKRKDSVVVQSYDTSVGHKNFRLYADGKASGIDFQERVKYTSSTVPTADLKHDISKDLKYTGTP